MLKKYFAISLASLLGLLLVTVFDGCKKNTVSKPPIETPLPPAPVTDVDGNIYPTVKIGNQVWMAKPLRVTHYNDSTPITHIVSKAAWASNTTMPARCYYGKDNVQTGDSDSAAYAFTYGALYNWAAVNTKKLAPLGYHIPDSNEYKILITYLEGASIAGQFLKSALYWTKDSDTNYLSRNKTGFTAIPSGYRAANGDFFTFGTRSFFWLSTQNPNVPTQSYAWQLTDLNALVVRTSLNQSLACSVVCIKD